MQQRLNIQKLQGPHTKYNFVTQVKKIFQALQDIDKEVSVDSINTVYENIQTAYREKKKSREWIKQNTWTVIEERHYLKQQMISTRSTKLQEGLVKRG